MARQFLRRLMQFSRRRKSQRIAGFTLLELLVAIIIGALITVLLMGLVIDLAEANQRDASRSQVQQDMQAAIDYIVQDLREAVFVYNGQCLEGGTATITNPTTGSSTTVSCPGVVNYIPDDLTTSERTPVLAFWRTEPLPQAVSEFCSTNADGRLVDPTDNQNPSNPLEINNLVGVCVSGKTYSLVVYSIDRPPPSNDIWPGQAHLTRYKLSRFRDNATDVVTDDYSRPEGGGIYVDPFSEPAFTFQQWPLDADGRPLQATRPTLGGRLPQAQVLVDFVSNNFVNDQGPVAPTCRDFVDPNAPPPQNDPTNQITPLDSVNPPRSFYACVRGGGLTTTTQGQNQDVLLSLVGNLTGKPGYSRQGPQIDPIQTRVLVRGVIAK